MSALWDALRGDSEPRAAAFVGGGGKTTSIKAIAASLAAGGRRVVITTTTKMRPPEEPGRLARTAAEAAALFRLYNPVWAGEPYDEFKMRGIEDAEREALAAAADTVLIEADGARRLPLKMTAAWEPVVPESAELVAVVCGLDCLGRPLRDVCHRWELTGLPGGETVTPELAAALLRRCYLDVFAHKNIAVLLNKADDDARIKSAAALAALLPGRRVVISRRGEPV